MVKVCKHLVVNFPIGFPFSGSTFGYSFKINTQRLPEVCIFTIMISLKKLQQFLILYLSFKIQAELHDHPVKVLEISSFRYLTSLLPIYLVQPVKQTFYCTMGSSAGIHA
jgi:hypothetical protein